MKCIKNLMITMALVFSGFDAFAGLTGFQCVENRPIDARLDKIIVDLIQNNSGRYDFKRTDIPKDNSVGSVTVSYYNLSCELDILEHSTGNLEIEGVCDWTVVPNAVVFSPGNALETVAVVGMDEDGDQIAYGKTFRCFANSR